MSEMKVKDLIEELKKHDPDKRVAVETLRRGLVEPVLEIQELGGRRYLVLVAK